IATRVELRPVSGLVAGTSFARGPFVSRAATRAALGADAESNPYTQTAWGGDVEYSRGYYVLRAETIVSAWRLPAPAVAAAQRAIDGDLTAVATSIEARYKLRPGLFAAARYDRLGFSDLTGARRHLRVLLCALSCVLCVLVGDGVFFADGGAAGDDPGPRGSAARRHGCGAAAGRRRPRDARRARRAGSAAVGGVPGDGAA